MVCEDLWRFGKERDREGQCLEHAHWNQWRFWMMLKGHLHKGNGHMVGEARKIPVANVTATPVSTFVNRVEFCP